MTFRELERRLQGLAKQKLLQGEISQRQLARRTGFTQPHIHNVLKGARRMTPALADALLAFLGLSVADLLHPGERITGHDAAPLWEGSVGPHASFPDHAANTGHLLFPTSFLSRFDEPVLLRVAGDEDAMAPMIEPNDVLLVDRGERGRAQPRFESIYAVSFSGRGAVCRCQRVGSALVLVEEAGHRASRLPDRIPLEKSSILDIVRGKVVWIGRQIEPFEI